MSTELEGQTAVVTSEPDEREIDVKPDSLSRRLPSADPSTIEEVQSFGIKLRYYSEKLPQQVNELLEIYQKPLLFLGIGLGMMLGILITHGVLDVLNAIPLVMPLLELVGLGYLGWFTWRYLRYADTRQELVQEYRRLKTRVIGDATVHLEAD